MLRISGTFTYLKRLSKYTYIIEETHDFFVMEAQKKEVKLYFIAFVLAHSRQKYMEWQDREHLWLIMYYKEELVSYEALQKKIEQYIDYYNYD